MALLKLSPEFAVAAISSIALHAVWLTHDAQASYIHETKPAEVLFEAEPVPVSKTEPDAPKPERAPPEPIERSPAPRAHADQKTAPQSAAQAGRTLTAPDTPDNSSIADFSMVQGEGNSYAGGTTSSIGTSAKAVHGLASLKPAATQREQTRAGTLLPAGPDRSRGATPAASNWNCSSLFPNDPDAGAYASVVIAVTVQTNGRPTSVAVIRDPGHGFAPAARACAMTQIFNVALDREGKPIVATTPPIVVHFTR